MSKGATIDEAFVQSLGLSEQLLTLSGPMENRHHEILQEPMFHIRTQEMDETIFLDRAYVFEHQVSIKSSYGKGDRILAWLQRVLRVNPQSPEHAGIELLMVRDFFLLDDWREFQRFKLFVKSMRILDAQARDFLAEHHQDFPRMVKDDVGLTRILDSLERVAEWPDLEAGAKASSLELVAKTYSRDLAPVRASPRLPALLLARPPDARFNLFRLLSFVEDPHGGSGALVGFLSAMGAATQDVATMSATATIKNGRDLQRGFAAIRAYLVSAKVPGG